MEKPNYTEVAIFCSMLILCLGKTWNSSAFDFERPVKEGRNRILGAQRRGFFALPDPKAPAFQSRRCANFTS